MVSDELGVGVYLSSQRFPCQESLYPAADRISQCLGNKIGDMRLAALPSQTQILDLGAYMSLFFPLADCFNVVFQVFVIVPLYNITQKWRISSENLRHRDDSAREFAGSESRGRTPYRRSPEVSVGSRGNPYGRLDRVEVHHLLSSRMAADEGEGRWEISLDDRRPIRPRAIKSPFYSRSRSGEVLVLSKINGTPFSTTSVRLISAVTTRYDMKAWSN